MDIRKIAAAAALTAGAAMALSPLAAADPADAAAAVDAAVVPITSTFTSEVASANSLFQLDALFAGVPSTDYSVGPQGLDFINVADVTKDAPASGTPTTLDYELFGVKPFTAGVSGDPGAANLFNGADAKFDDAYNVALYSFENNGALDPNAADFFGNLPANYVTDTPAQAFEYFYNFGIGDLSGFFNTDLSSLDISAQSATELFSLLGSL